MASIGNLGVERPAVDLDFQYFGETIRVHPDATDLDVADFMALAGDLDIEDEEQAKEAMVGLSQFMVGQIHPDDRQRFWEAAKRNRQQIKDLILVAKTITEAVAEQASGFPTGQPSASPATTRSASGKSKGATSSQARAARRAARPSQATRAAMAQLEGRPDLKLALVRQQQAQADDQEEASA